MRALIIDLINFARYPTLPVGAVVPPFDGSIELH
jgi:hypothetical protein